MDEFFTIVGRDHRRENPPLLAYGCVARALAHGPHRIPHASVQVIPIRCRTGNVVVHQRSTNVGTSKGRWDVLGGHITFEPGILLTTTGLEAASWQTAIRETREEMLISVEGKPHLVEKGHLHQIGQVGQFEHADDMNVEYSTAFAVAIPERATLAVPFESHEGNVEWLQVKELPWQRLIDLYETNRQNPSSNELSGIEFHEGFADGVGRILKRVAKEPAVHRDVETAISWCRAHTM